MFLTFLAMLLATPAAPVAPAAPLPTNAEMTAIFDADQAAREHPTGIDWTVLHAQDTLRRGRTQALLDGGSLHSGDDFYHAAFVFQHGEEPGDFLKAHALAIVALARGKNDAAWIAAATLDRYLQAIGRPQIYGTQYAKGSDGRWTQEPYKRDTVPDTLRQAAGVKTQAEQEIARQEIERTFAKSRK